MFFFINYNNYRIPCCDSGSAIMSQLREMRLGALRCIQLVLVTLVSGYSVI